MTTREHTWKISTTCHWSWAVFWKNVLILISRRRGSRASVWNFCVGHQWDRQKFFFYTSSSAMNINEFGFWNIAAVSRYYLTRENVIPGETNTDNLWCGSNCGLPDYQCPPKTCSFLDPRKMPQAIPLPPFSDQAIGIIGAPNPPSNPPSVKDITNAMHHSRILLNANGMSGISLLWCCMPLLWCHTAQKRVPDEDVVHNEQYKNKLLFTRDGSWSRSESLFR